MSEDQPLFFFKFGSKENMTDLLENGTIYFNTIDYFQRLEGQGLRGDKYEGTIKITNFHEYEKLKVTITIPETGKRIPINPKKFHLREFLKDIKGNLFSMYCLRPKDIIGIVDFKIDQRVKEFGTHFVLIKDVGRFIDEVCNKLENTKMEYQTKQVEYYEKDKINSDISLFDKMKEFEYQKEFRIVLYNNEMAPKIIRIGSLKEYAAIFPVDALDTLEVKWNPNNIKYNE
jgi:hypothetical protein